MIGIILITISWILLRLHNLSLSVLGFNKPLQRLGEFSAGFMVAGIFAATQFFLVAYFSEFDWRLNPDVSASMIFESLRWNINSVMYEELLFRGYLLFMAIKYLGDKKACFLSAAVFGIYHWFSYGVFGALIPMVFVFLLTASFGLMLSFSFLMSKSVILPIALHLGWNIITILIFSNGPLGDQILVPSLSEPETMSSIEQVITSLIIPISLVVLVIWVITKRIPLYKNDRIG